MKIFLKKLGKNMMKIRTPTQIKELKNTNLNTKFSFLTRDCPQITTTNPTESATKPSTIHHKSKTINPSTTHTNPSEQTTPPKSDYKKKRNSASLSAIPFRSENETHHQTPICERIPPPNSDLCHHRNPPPNFNLNH